MVVTTYFRNSASNMPFGMMTLFPLILNMVLFELDYCSMMQVNCNLSSSESGL